MPFFERFLELPLGAVALVLFVVLLAAREAGCRLQQRVEARRPDASATDASNDDFDLSAVFGLLALLVAFTFGMALDRYGDRREIVVAEANAIGTAYLRVQLLDDAPRARLSALLRDYAGLRLRYGEADERGKATMQREVAARQSAIASAAVAELRPYRTMELGPSLVESINTVLDVGAERQALNAARLPMRLLGVLLIYTLVAAVIHGYARAHAGANRRGAAAVLFLLLTLAITTILDLDRPQSGAIRVTQEPMRDLVGSLQ